MATTLPFASRRSRATTSAPATSCPRVNGRAAVPNRVVGRIRTVTAVPLGVVAVKESVPTVVTVRRAVMALPLFAPFDAAGVGVALTAGDDAEAWPPDGCAIAYAPAPRPIASTATPPKISRERFRPCIWPAPVGAAP